MTVHFIGAGPGAADLITVRGLRLIKSSPVILYAGSLVPNTLFADVGENVRIRDTASMNLDEIIDEIKRAVNCGKDVARVHSGDPSLYGATAEQMRRLDQLGINYDVTPGVPAYAAAAGVLRQELTLPSLSQTIILTRTSTQSSPMPSGETLVELGKTQATLAIHLSVNNLRNVVRDLTPSYGADCSVVVMYRVTWPDQLVIRGTLENIRLKVKQAGITRTALILVGKIFDSESFDDSRLYAPDHHHVLRPKKRIK